MDETSTLERSIRGALGDRSESWLADQTGIPQRTLNRWMKDPGRMPIEALMKIARVLDTTTVALWTGEAA